MHRPARERTEFVGREEVIKNIRSSLGNSPVERPLIICGPVGIGKTSLLHQLAGGALDADVGVLYTDIQKLDTETISGFLWQLAKAIMVSMKRQDLDGPIIEKRMLVLNPQLVFRQRFWNPLLMRAHSVPLLLAWDNFDALAQSGQGSHNLQSLRAYLYGLLKTDAPVDVLLTITGRVEAVGENALAPFHLESYLRLTNLDRDQTLRLIDQAAGLKVFRPVAEFMYSLTNGHPGDTQQLCHALFERQWQRGHRQVAIADVVAVLKEDLRPSDFVGSVYHRLDSPSSAAILPKRIDFAR